MAGGKEHENADSPWSILSRLGPDGQRPTRRAFDGAGNRHRQRPTGSAEGGQDAVDQVGLLPGLFRRHVARLMGHNVGGLMTAAPHRRPHVAAK
jgi:hypothetical protein